MTYGASIIAYILTLICYTIYPPMVIYFISEVLQEKVRYKKHLYIISFLGGIVSAVLYTSVPPYFPGFGLVDNMPFRRASIYLFCFIIVMFLTGNPLKRFLIAICGRAIMIDIHDIFSAIGYLITGSDYATENTTNNLTLAVLAILWFLLEFVMFAFIARMRKKKKDNTTQPLIVTVTLSIIITFSAKSLPIYRDVPGSLADNKRLYLIFMLLSLTSFVVLYYITASRKERKELLELNQVKEDLILSEARYFEAAAGMDNKIRALKHDMKNNVAVLSLLLKNGEYDKMKDYLDEMGAAIETADVSAHTGNTIADVIIAEKREKAKEAGAVLKVSGSISDINFSPVDTCKILANILDNAIEAVNDEKLSDLDESIKIISLDFRHTNNFLMMSLKNPCADKPRIKNGSPETTKRDAKNHGFGLKNVREAAAVYSGELSFECNEKPYGYEFSTELLFPINA